MTLIRIDTDEKPYKPYSLYTSRVPVVGEFVMIGSWKKYKVIEVCHVGADKVHDSYVAFVKVKEHKPFDGEFLMNEILKPSSIL